MSPRTDNPHEQDRAPQQPAKPVGSRVHAGLKWVTLSLAWIRSLQFVVTIVLARLLEPEAFGLVALALAVTMILTALREVGLGQALIQRPDRGAADTLRAVNTMFFLTMGLNLAFFCGAQAGAPSLAALLPRMGDEVVPVLRWMLIPLTFSAFGSTAAFLLQRRLEFGRQSLADGAAALANATVAISCAIAGCGVWSIVAGLLAGRLVNTALLVYFVGWLPRMQFCRQTARELFRFGKYMWLFGLVDTAGRQLDRFVLAGLLGAGPLGLYNLAYNFCRMPANQVGSLVNRIAFPALARKQGDKAALGAGFMKALSHVTVLAMPFGFGVCAVASEFVPVVYGDKWAAASPIMMVFAFYGTLLAVSSVAGPVLQAMGRPNVIFYTGLAHL
ncbi:MAG: lipopolysaccharide biosynthesis protein, partial [Planctomycetota bacterium]